MGGGGGGPDQRDRLTGTSTGTVAPTLPAMSRQEEALADLWATGVGRTAIPTFLRDGLTTTGS